MRERLVRSTVIAVVLSVVIVGAPLFLGAVWMLANEGSRLRTWLVGGQSMTQLAQLLGVITALSVLAVVVGVLVASAQARKFSEPMTKLADRAERLGAGESRFQPLVS